MGMESARVQLIREIPDVGLAAQFDGEPLVQSFRVQGRKGRVWITTREALAIPGFGAPWVAGQLTALQAELGTRAFNRALLAGVRLHADTRELAIAA
jgi:hypothetical protein